MMMNTTTARAVRYIYRDSREKTERESPLLHREMICHMIDMGCSAVVGQIKVVQNPSKIKRTAAEEESFCRRSEKSVFTFGFFRHKISNSSASLSCTQHNARNSY